RARAACVEYARLQCRAERIASHRRDEQAEHEVVRVRVLPPRAGSEVRLVAVCDLEQSGRPPRVAEVPVQVWAKDPPVVEVVVQTARLLQELTHGDPLAAAHLA